MSARLRTIDPPEGVISQPFMALVCDNCEQPVLLHGRFDDFVLRHMALGWTPRRLAEMVERHQAVCPGWLEPTS